jgi:hypothetical protein
MPAACPPPPACLPLLAFCFFLSLSRTSRVEQIVQVVVASGGGAAVCIARPDRQEVVLIALAGPRASRLHLHRHRRRAARQPPHVRRPSAGSPAQGQAAATTTTGGGGGAVRVGAR